MRKGILRRSLIYGSATIISRWKVFRKDNLCGLNRFRLYQDGTGILQKGLVDLNGEKKRREWRNRKWEGGKGKGMEMGRGRSSAGKLSGWPWTTQFSAWSGLGFSEITIEHAGNLTP